MSLDGQLERLCALYDEKSDDQLQAMYADRDDLTELAQQALTEVMRRRGISPGTAAAETVSVRTEPVEADPDSLLAEDEVCVYSFDDAFQANEALRLMAEAGIEPRVVDWNQLPSETAGYHSIVNLGVVVRRVDERAAMAVLTDEMGMFPKQEGSDPFAEMDGLMQVGYFERPDALLAAAALGEAGVSFVWNDDRDDRKARRDNVSIEVQGERLERALKLVQARLDAAE